MDIVKIVFVDGPDNGRTMNLPLPEEGDVLAIDTYVRSGRVDDQGREIWKPYK